MTNYEYFFGDVEKVVQLLCGYSHPNKQFTKAWLAFKAKKLEASEQTANYYMKSETIQYFESNIPSWWREFLNSEVDLELS